MTSGRDEWGRLDALLEEALERPASERGRWLDEACRGDAALRARLDELLRLAETEDEAWEPGGALAAWPGAAEETLLGAGQRLGRYEIVGLLGTGGMGRVYRAIDPTLGREVAIKALAHSFRDDPASLRRFEREARTLAALNHPSIATIYGFEMLEGAPYLVLELVDGETLLQRLERGPLPLAAAVDVARPLAEALEEAHRKGVIHRDLKPSNVMLATDGRVKVLDFGLAKTLAAPAGEASRAPTSRLATASGTVLGTAPYMSPEQARGGTVDTRTDVWAFGCLLYEMLCGRRAFDGRTVPDILASVLRDDVDWTALPKLTPAPVRRLLERCLRKDPHDRLQDIGDARLELAELTASSGPRPTGVGDGLRRLAWPIAVAAVLVAGAVALLRNAAPAAPPRVLRLGLELPSSISLSADFPPPYALSPDGTQIAFVGGEGDVTRLYLRRIDALSVRALPGTEGARQPFFSPDGRWLGYFVERKLLKQRLDGGPPVALAEVGGNLRGAAWAPGGTIVFSPTQTSGLRRMPDSGGASSVLTSLDADAADVSHRWPEVLPGGRWVLYTVGVEEAVYDEARLEAVSLETGERRPVVANASFGRFLPGSTLLFARAGMLFSVPFAPEKPAAHGEREVVVEGIQYDPRNGAAHLAVSASGTVLYTPAAPVPPERRLAWLDPSGRLSRLLDEPRRFGQPRLSPDGTRLAVRIGPPAASDLWSLDIATSTLTRISHGLSPHRPVWHPDGRALCVGRLAGGRWQLISLPASAAGASAVLHAGTARMYPNDWSPDGRRLVFQERSPGAGWDLRLLEVDGAGQPAGPVRSIAATPFNEEGGAVSPDGTLIAYELDEVDGVVHVYVRAFPDGEDKVQVSAAGARVPRWGRDGRLYYWSNGAREFYTAVVRLQGGRPAVVESGKPLLPPGAGQTADRLMVTSLDGFDVDASGRLLVLEPPVVAAPPNSGRPVLALNWDGRRVRSPRTSP